MAYRLLSAVVGGLCILVGVVAFVGFFRYHAPGSPATDPLPIGPGGAYYMAFLGSSITAWGICLLGASRRPLAAPWIASATAIGLVMNALYRMIAWVVGDYAALGELPRVEAAIMLALALGFVWLKPRIDPPAAPAAG